jgi:hypothetical protein
MYQRIGKKQSSPRFTKKGKRTDPGNYRPVSLTSVPCKVFESIIKDKIMTHLLQNKLQSKGISGEVYDWLRAWLMDRTQRVRIGDDFSSEEKVYSGVPQNWGPVCLGSTLMTLTKL